MNPRKYTKRQYLESLLAQIGYGNEKEIVQKIQELPRSYDKQRNVIARRAERQLRRERIRLDKIR